MANVVREVRYEGLRGIVLIEAQDADSTDPIDTARREAVVQILQRDLETDKPPQTEVRHLAGRGYRKLLIVLWSLVFLPLAAYLGMQVMIYVTKGKSEEV